MIRDAHEFWVIFDTATEPEYYQDVHNILALPEGAIIRYEYRSTYLSPRSIEHLETPRKMPRCGLVVFTQPQGANRGNRFDASALRSGKVILWVATRLVQLRASPIRNGEFFSFDLQLLKYPHSIGAQLQRIIAPLVQKGETPYGSKWVSISDQVAALANLKVGTDSDNWQEIIKQIGQPEALFAGDFFWRLRGPFIDRFSSVVPLNARYWTSSEIASGQRVARGTRFSYLTTEGGSVLIDATSYRPSGVPGRVRSILTIDVEKDGPVVLHGGAATATANMRRYTTQTIRVHAKRYDELERREGPVRFGSGGWIDGFPVGPDLELPFSVRRNMLRLFFALAAILEAVALTFYATKLPAVEFGTALFYVILAFLMTIAGVFMLTGRLTIPRIP